MLAISLDLRLVLGIDRSQLNSSGEGFFLEIESFTVSAEAMTSDLEFSARLGANTPPGSFSISRQKFTQLACALAARCFD